ncbi:MAG: hypothetical protein HC866_14740 [Leptolyngbyaceae cyanobacterium RU_5_1]|nr:hypothetical protein [Leptolyngbyaceae cyanobacterium RU_5_1]
MITADVFPHPTVTVAQVIKRILGTGKITRADEQFFLWVVAARTHISDEDANRVTDIYDRLKMGLLKVVD